MEKIKAVQLHVPDYIYQKHREENLCLEMIDNLCKDGDFDILMLKTKLIEQEHAQKFYQFVLQFVETSVTFEEFLPVFKSYELVAVGITKIDKKIIGMIMNRVEIDVIDGKQYALLPAGLSFLESRYFGSIFYAAIAAYFSLRALFLYPTLPLYYIVKSFTYKSYLLGPRYYKTIYPRRGVKTPEWEQKIIIKFGNRFEGRFIDSNGVIQRERTKVIRGVADISEEDLNDPDIKFYCEQNPGWKKGHGLIGLAVITWEDVANLIQKAVAKSQKHSKTSKLIPESNL